MRGTDCKPLDLALLDGFVPSGRDRSLVLATKCDKLDARTRRRSAAAAIRRELAERYPAHASRLTVIPFSATRGVGVAEADAILVALARPRSACGDAQKRKGPAIKGSDAGP